MASFGESPSDTHSRSDSTIPLWYDCDTAAYDHSDPEEIGKTQGKEKKDSERRSGFNPYYRRKQITRGRYITKHLLTLTPAGAESDLKRYGERRLARRKSPILTAQTTRPLQKKWPRGELW